MTPTAPAPAPRQVAYPARTGAHAYQPYQPVGLGGAPLYQSSSIAAAYSLPPADPLGGIPVYEPPLRAPADEG